MLWVTIRRLHHQAIQVLSSQTLIQPHKPSGGIYSETKYWHKHQTTKQEGAVANKKGIILLDMQTRHTSLNKLSSKGLNIMPYDPVFHANP